MAIEYKPIRWINNQTRLNAKNMNDISGAIDEIVYVLDGDNNNGLINQVDKHEIEIYGDGIENHGINTLISQLGRAVLTPNFDNRDNKPYSFDTIHEHEIRLPVVKNYGWADTSDGSTDFTSTSNSLASLLGTDTRDGLIDILAEHICWSYEQFRQIGNVYRPTSIQFATGQSITTDNVGNISVNVSGKFGVTSKTLTYTSSDGTKILNHSGDTFSIFDNNVIIKNDGSIDTTGGAINTQGGSISCGDISAQQIDSNSIIPNLNNEYNLGSDDKRWANITALNGLIDTLKVIDLTTNTLSGVTLKGSIVPDKTNTYTLGASDKVFKTGYFNLIKATDIEVSNNIKSKTVVVTESIEAPDANITNIENETLSSTTADIANLSVEAEEVAESDIETLRISVSADVGTDDTPIQGTNQSSVVVYKTLKAEEARALAAEKVLTDNLTKEVQDRIADIDAEQERAEAAELKLTDDLANETANRIAADNTLTNSLNTEINNRTTADNQITAAYKKADTELETKIIGNVDDTVEDNTLNGVINYAIAEDEKITAAYTAKDAELQTDIDAINLALSYLADKDVIATEPSFRFSSSNVTTVEVGTNITPNFNITFDDGEYEYGPDPTGSNASGYEVTFNGESLTTSSGTFTAVHVIDSTSLTLSAKCTYTDGNTPKNNLGLDYVAGKIVGATKTITKTLKGYRQAFAGGSESKSVSVSSLVSSDIRALVAKGNGKKTFDVTIDATDIRVLVAFPSSWGSLKSVLDVNDSNKNIVSAFGSAVTVSVSGATADEDMMNYKLYVMDFASAYGGEGNTYKVTIG